MVTKSKTPAITVTAKPVETISVFQKNALAHAGAIPGLHLEGPTCREREFHLSGHADMR